MSDWQPIETAPRDGTRVLLYTPGAECPWIVGEWARYEDAETGVAEHWWAPTESVLADVCGEIEGVTHWCELDAPPPPEGESET